jgi:hypothetical protein|tara:strand:- start:111 stop:578 length:468 start_codon:yes stop_codon:yes gene_type:complete
MARIIAYPYANSPISEDDCLLGTQKDNGSTNQSNPTKNFGVGQVVVAGLGYTSYVARITQLATSDPVALEIKNNTNATYTWSRTGIGAYEVQTDINILDASDTLVFGNIGENVKPDYFRWRVANVNVIEVTTYDKDGNPTDGIFANGSFEIRIYN